MRKDKIEDRKKQMNRNQKISEQNDPKKNMKCLDKYQNEIQYSNQIEHRRFKNIVDIK